MSHRKITRGSRAALVARFPPDGYVLVEVLDQTIGYIVDGASSTIVHREATLYPSRKAALDARVAHLAAWRSYLVESIADETKDVAMRSHWQTVVARIDADDGTGDPWSKTSVDPWIEPVQVWAHFCDRPDTW